MIPADCKAKHFLRICAGNNEVFLDFKLETKKEKMDQWRADEKTNLKNDDGNYLFCFCHVEWSQTSGFILNEGSW